MRGTRHPSARRVTGTSAGPRPEDEPRSATTAARWMTATYVGVCLVLFLGALPARYRQLVEIARTARATAAHLGAASTPGLSPRPSLYATAVLSLEVLFVASLTLVSAAIVWRRTDYRPGLLFAATFVGYAVWVTPTLDALDLPGSWRLLDSSVQATGQLLAVVFFCTFPDGRFFPRWTRALALGWGAFAAAWALFPESAFSLQDPFTATLPAALALLLGGWGMGLLAQRARFQRKADDEQRRQTKVVMLVILGACVAYGAVYLPGILIPEGTTGRIAYDLYGVPIFFLLALPIPIALTVAMLRHRLFGVPSVIVRAIVFGIVATFITVVYLAIVTGIGSLLSQGGRPNLALSLVATAVVALAFQPVRQRAQRFANQVVYGRRARPDEALAEFARHAGETHATQDLLPLTARILAEGTRATQATVWLRAGDQLLARCSWPEPDGPELPPLEVADEEPASTPEVSLFLPVRERGELLGALSLVKEPGERPTHAEEALARNLASQAGLVLRNVLLTEELLERVRELQESRQRIVTAQDRERRRLERDIHDGAQQQLVAIAVKAGLARTLLGSDPEATHRTLEELQGDAAEAVQTLRDLARGIYPPLLADEGLGAALRAQANKVPFSVTIETDGVDRYSQEVEAAVYFCVLEALQNASKHGDATNAAIELDVSDRLLGFRVIDDGAGFDPATTRGGSGLQNMADRLEALGGSLEIRSRPGEGTEIRGTVPVGNRSVSR